MAVTSAAVVIHLGSAARLPAQGTTTAVSAPAVVEVTGEGPTRWAARSDAVRAALQRTMRQLVVADRAVSDDVVLRDRVLSTMNGFVDGFEVLTERGTADGYRMTARVSVSPTRIRSFVALARPAAGVAVDGDQLLARLQADQLARRTRTDVVKRLVGDSYDGIVSASLLGYAQPAVAPAGVTLTIGVRLDTAYLAQLTAGLRELGARWAREEECAADAENGCREGGVYLTVQRDAQRLQHMERPHSRTLWLNQRLSEVVSLPSDSAFRFFRVHGVPGGGAGTAKAGYSAVVYTDRRLRVVSLDLATESCRGAPHGSSGGRQAALWTTGSWSPNTNQLTIGCITPWMVPALVRMPTGFFEGARAVHVTLVRGRECVDTVERCVRELHERTGVRWAPHTESHAMASLISAQLDDDWCAAAGDACYWRPAPPATAEAAPPSPVAESGAVDPDPPEAAPERLASALVDDLIDATNRRDLTALDALYTERPLLFGRQTTRAARAAADRAYFRRWPVVRFERAGPVAVRAEGGQMVVTYEMAFDVRSPAQGRHTIGRARERLVLARSQRDGPLRIAAHDETILSRTRR